jgi:hypothetical protein
MTLGTPTTGPTIRATSATSVTTFTIAGATQTTSATAGGTVTVTGGAGSTSGAGGVATIQGGLSSTGVMGATYVGGNTFGGSQTAGATLVIGNCTTAGSGGSTALNSNNYNTTAFTITQTPINWNVAVAGGSTAIASIAAGNVLIAGGANSSNGFGGPGSGGQVYIVGGSATGAGGVLTSGTAINGGTTTIAGGNGYSIASSVSAGNLILAGGITGTTTSGTGTAGYISLQTAPNTSGTGAGVLVERLRIDSTGEWLVGGSAGTSGYVLTSNGANTPPTWQAGGGGAVTSVTASGSGITAAPTTGAVVITNTGVTSAVAGTNIAVSGATGAVTISVTGTVTAATTATNATNSAITNNNGVSSATWYPTFVSAGTGNLPLTVDSSTNILSYVPSTGALNATVFNTPSDRDLKTNITKIDNALNIVEALNGVRFNWKTNGLPSAGIIAQDLEKVMPELVSKNETSGPLSVNHNGIIGILVEAIKEMNTTINALKLEVAELKAR